MTKTPEPTRPPLLSPMEMMAAIRDLKQRVDALEGKTVHTSVKHPVPVGASKSK